MKRLVAITPVLVALTAAAPLGCGGNEIEAYCSYGAVSQAQLAGCIDHVTTRDIDRLDTNAARYAKGELDRCLADSGPFCENR